VLERKGALQNAVVVVYSDHGEAFGIPAEALVQDDDPLTLELQARPTWGHGTSVLTAHQYHVLLGIRGFGAAKFAGSAGRVFDAPVSVEDITPTMVSVTGARTTSPFSGRSLAPLLRAEDGAAQSFTGRIRFTETEYQPKGLATANGKVSASALEDAARVYRVDPATDRLEVRRSKLSSLLVERQYAALGDESLLAAIPSPTELRSYRYVVVPHNGGPAKPLLTIPGSSESAELRRLWQALYSEFHEILSDLPAGVMAPAGSDATDLSVAKDLRDLAPSVHK
jgi:hypothetical protein